MTILEPFRFLSEIHYSETVSISTVEYNAVMFWNRFDFYSRLQLCFGTVSISTVHNYSETVSISTIHNYSETVSISTVHNYSGTVLISTVHNYSGTCITDVWCVQISRSLAQLLAVHRQEVPPLPHKKVRTP